MVCNVAERRATLNKYISDHTASPGVLFAANYSILYDFWSNINRRSHVFTTFFAWVIRLAGAEISKFNVVESIVYFEQDVLWPYIDVRHMILMAKLENHQYLLYYSGNVIF